MDSRPIREFYGFTQKEISDIFGIPLKTVQSWEYRHNMPSYVSDMMNKYFALMRVVHGVDNFKYYVLLEARNVEVNEDEQNK